MKLELKHIAPYLPYGVQIEVTDYCIELGSYEQKKETYTTTLDAYGLHYFNTNVRLILRPLSDLTKEIEHNGEKLVPSKLLNFDFSDLSQFDYEYIPYNLAAFLLEHHFDIFGLIENGLAIDINTL